MARDRRTAEELSIEELESLLARRKMEARQERLQRFQRSGRALHVPQAEPPLADQPPAEGSDEQAPGAGRKLLRRVFDRLLLLIEVAAVGALIFLLFRGYQSWQEINEQSVAGLEAPTAEPTPLITAVVLPSGHTPPTSPGGAAPNEAEIPANLRPLVQSLARVPIPTPGPEHPISIFIPELWNAPAPVVQGDGWEQLKKGVGQHVGSANPGKNGNLVLSAHNDIFGELFRFLDRLGPGDEIYVNTGSASYTYRVTETRIVEPTEVSVMDSRGRATITLISCYPYLVDNQRIVVFGELVKP